MMPADRERDRRSLQDLAKLASMTPAPMSVRPSTPSASGLASANPSGAPASMHSVPRAEAASDDSGIVDLAAAAAADPQAAERAKATQLGSAGLFDDGDAARSAPVSSVTAHVAQPAPSLPPPASSSMPLSVAPASGAAIASASAAPAAARPQGASASGKKGAPLGVILGGLLAASAAAAGGFLYMKGQATPAAPAVTETAPAVVAQAEPAKPAVAAPTPAPEATLDPSALSTETAPDAKGAHAAKAGGHTTAPAKHAAGAAKAEPKDEPKLAQKDLPAPAATGPAGALGDEMRKAVGANENAGTTAAAGPTGPAAGTVPQKPSQGAVTGALGAVLPAARACLGPDDPISRASVVFSSSGTVQSVNVTGGAAGKPAEGCIKTALLKAKVAPFAEATYSAPVTIRH